MSRYTVIYLCVADICTMLQHLLQPWQTRFFCWDSDNLFIWTLCTIKWFYTYKLFWCASVGCSRDQIILHPLPPASRLLNKPIFQKKLIKKSLTWPVRQAFLCHIRYHSIIPSRVKICIMRYLSLWDFCTTVGERSIAREKV